MLDKEKFKSLFGDWWRYVEPNFHLLEPIYKELKSQSRRKKQIFPEWQNTFKAFEKCPLANLKVVMIGLDPYPWMKDGVIVADGLAFSCSKSPIQPSLEHIFKGIENDFQQEIHSNKDLTYWAEQGVLLLNSSLTVEKNKVGSHSEIWQPFMKKILEEISYNNSGLIFWLIGAEAKKLQGSINNLGNYLMYTEHPAAAEHSQRDWEHKNTFSKINKILQTNNMKIDWLFEEELPF